MFPYIKYTQIFSIFHFTVEIGGLHNPLKDVYFSNTNIENKVFGFEWK